MPHDPFQYSGIEDVAEISRSANSPNYVKGDWLRR